ncbi:MAG: PHP domain-containing protein [Oscillospiraceae bacterium]
MYLADQHIHSTCSDDGKNTMLEMALASQAQGVRHICFTDHCDLDYFPSGIPDPNCFSIRPQLNEMYAEAASAAPDGITLALGLELGEGNHDPARAMEIAAAPELDLVLGSIHNLRGMADFYGLEYPDESFCRQILDSYMDELLELSSVDCFDIMAHIGYPIRYTRRHGFKAEFSLHTHGDKLEALLKALIEQGRGIEINCAGFRNPIIGGAIPDMDILKLYRQLGGEIITLGSDAHCTADAGSGLARGFDILRKLRYKYIAVYSKRKPSFVKLPD